MSLPSRDVISSFVEDMRSVLFPGYFGVSDVTGKSLRFHVGATLDRALLTLKEQINRGLCFACENSFSGHKCVDCERNSSRLAHRFSMRIPHIKTLLKSDVQAVFDGDPAAYSTDEAIFCYPGVLAITNHRIAHELYKLEIPVIPRMISELAHSSTGIDIHPGATIGKHFFIDHGTGVVIGETSVIGDNVTIYQGVTLGARSIPFDGDGKPIKGVARHPVVENGVIIYAGATILGRVTIGERSIIGGNIWLTRSVPKESRITQARVRTESFENGGGI
jgi:serine O-acetyltransferase